MGEILEHIRHKILSTPYDDNFRQRKENARVVFTNGCFDILHYGHVRYLAQARAMGDLLVIGLNDDASVGRLKGPSRPVNPLEARAMLIASLEMVDFVIPFGEDTPERLIKAVRPDILVKGGDYQMEDIVGADFVTRHGGAVRTLPFADGFSTTSILKRLSDR